jgi:hypothetical protein
MFCGLSLTYSYLAVLLKVLELPAGEDGGVGQLAQDGPNIATGASIFILRFYIVHKKTKLLSKNVRHS